MRLMKFLSLSINDSEINRFRSMYIGLTKDKNKNVSFINDICEKYNVNNVYVILDSLNNELRKFYNGKYFYDFIEETDKPLKRSESISENRKKSENITLLLLEANNKLSRIKARVEEQLKIVYNSPEK